MDSCWFVRYPAEARWSFSVIFGIGHHMDRNVVAY